MGHRFGKSLNFEGRVKLNFRKNGISALRKTKGFRDASDTHCRAENDLPPGGEAESSKSTLSAPSKPIKNQGPPPEASFMVANDCPYCEKPARPDWSFCPYCRTPLTLNSMPKFADRRQPDAVNASDIPEQTISKSSGIWRQIAIVVLAATLCGFGYIQWRTHQNQPVPAQPSTPSVQPPLQQQTPVVKLPGNTPFTRENYKAALAKYYIGTEKFQLISNDVPYQAGQTLTFLSLKIGAGKQVELKIIEKDQTLDHVEMSVFINRKESVSNPDFNYLLKLLDTMYPADKNANKELLKNGIESVLKSQEYSTTRGEAIFRFRESKAAGGATGESTVILSINKAG